jgi:hypothetical protein
MGGNPIDRIVTLALAMAETGKYSDATSIERELLAAGHSVYEAVALNRPAVRVLLDKACTTGRDREEPTSHQYTT